MMASLNGMHARPSVRQLTRMFFCIFIAVGKSRPHERMDHVEVSHKEEASCQTTLSYSFGITAIIGPLKRAMSSTGIGAGMTLSGSPGYLQE
jgi:hypothetical protein